ncbi:hypothetical protein ACFXTI_014598 [Malus domestica]
MGEVGINREDVEAKLRAEAEKKDGGECDSSVGTMWWEKLLPTMNMRVLLVEADDSTRHIIVALLKKCSCRVGVPTSASPKAPVAFPAPTMTLELQKDLQLLKKFLYSVVDPDPISCEYHGKSKSRDKILFLLLILSSFLVSQLQKRAN